MRTIFRYSITKLLFKNHLSEYQSYEKDITIILLSIYKTGKYFQFSIKATLKSQ